MTSKQRILFVDDEQQVLDGLRRSLYRMREQWDMVFAPGGNEALEYMRQMPADVVVSDMRMPGMNGAELLDAIQREYPDTVRIVLSGYSGKELLLRSATAAHQILAKPCDPEMLLAAIKRSIRLRGMLNSPAILRVVDRLESVPVLPSVYHDLMDAIGREKIPMSEVGSILRRDVGLTSKVLQIVNSPFFGLRREIDDPSEAVVYLGLETVRAIVLRLGAFSLFDPSHLAEFDIEAIEGHSLRVGTGARRICSRLGLSQAAQGHAFAAGLLHSVGILILAKEMSADLRQVFLMARESGCSLEDAEVDVFGTTHMQLGGYLLGLWGLPDAVIEAVMFHTNPEEASEPGPSPLTGVHIANALDHEHHPREGAWLPSLQMSYVERLNLAEHIPVWRTIVFEDAAPGEVEAMGVTHGV